MEKSFKLTTSFIFLIMFYTSIFQFIYERDWSEKVELLKKLTQEILDTFFPEIPDDERRFEGSEFELQLMEALDIDSL